MHRRRCACVAALLLAQASAAWPCDDRAQGQPSARRSPSASAHTLKLVSLQGCVMDAGAMPSHTPVHAMSPAGRLLATAHPDERWCSARPAPMHDRCCCCTPHRKT